MAFFLEYKSRRLEVWNWYWRAMRKYLWKEHLKIIVMIPILMSMVLFLMGYRWNIYRVIVYSVYAYALISVFMLLYPQLKFKPQMRSLRVDEQGIATSVGMLSKVFTWSEIKSMEIENDFIVITRKNLNAFIIPARAFNSEGQRQDFVVFTKQMLSSVSRPRPAASG